MTLPLTRPALRYYGGKFRLAPWIIGFFPQHVCYVEPFGGAMSVLLRKPPSKLEVYNDQDGEVVNFFRVLRSRPQELLQAIKLTPFSRVEYVLAHEEADDELERARRLYVRSWQGIGGPRHRDTTGWRFERKGNRYKTTIEDWIEIGHLPLVVARLRDIQIECDEALKVIRRFDAPRTLFYCDPPLSGRDTDPPLGHQGLSARDARRTAPGTRPSAARRRGHGDREQLSLGAVCGALWGLAEGEQTIAYQQHAQGGPAADGMSVDLAPGSGDGAATMV